MAHSKEAARILIVEDEIIIAADLESRLNGLGYTVCGKATSGEKALKLVEQYQPDLVMMDIVLQGEMDGIDAAEVIRDKWSIPVVFITAYAETDRLERAKLTYPFGYLLKPFQDRDLKITVEMALYVAKVDLERRKMESELRKTKNELEMIIEKVPGLLALVDTDEKYIFVNNAYADWYGQSSEAIKGKKVEEILPPTTYKNAKKNISLVLKGEYLSYENIFPMEDGHENIVFAEYIPHFDHQGKVIAFLARVEDITDCKKAEKMVRDSEARFRGLYEHAPLGYQSLNGEGRLIHVNQAWLDMLGYQKDQVIDHWFGDFLPPDEIDSFKQRFKKFIQTVDIHADINMLRRDGSTILVHIDGKTGLDQNGRLKYTHCILQDVTNHKQAEAALKESEERYRGIFENTFNGIAIYKVIDEGSDFIFVDFNHQGEIIDNLSKKDLIGKRLTKVFPGVNEFGLLDVLKRVWKTGNSERFPIARYIDERITGWRENFIYKMPSGEIVAIYRDETDRKPAEKMLKYERDLNKMMMETSPAGITRVDANGHVVYANKRAEEILGIKLSKDVERTYNDPVWKITGFNGESFPDEELPFFIVKRIEKPVFGVQHAIEWPNGRRVLLSINAAPLFDSSGLFDGMVASVDDITNRYMVEEALQDSEERFRSIVENSAAGYFFIDRNGCFRSVNTAWLRLHKYDFPEEILGHHFSTTQIEEDQALLEEIIKRLKAGASVAEGELKRRCKDGSLGWHIFSINPVQKEGKVIGLEGFLVDITERKQAEVEREKLINQLQGALNTIKTLKGLLPICANCKKIRDDTGYWHQVERYVQEHSDVQFSHGICPECLVILYPEFCE